MEQTKKILFVVDDDKHVRNLIKMSLINQYDIRLFDNPITALSAIAENQPFLILLDLHIPSVDGFEMLRMLKDHPLTYDIPVICISSDAEEKTRESIKKLGGLGLIQKPLKPESLQTIIDGFLQNVFIHLHDKSKQHNFYLYYNNQEKELLFEKICHESAEQEIPIYFISWKKGDYYRQNNIINKLIENDQLVFLEIKSSLPTRLPYLQDLSPIYHDLEQFYNISPRKSHIIIDDLRQLLTSGPNIGRDKLISFANYFKHDFMKVTILSTMSRREEISNTLQHIAREFVKR